MLSNTDNRSSAATFAYPYTDDPFARPSSAYLGPPSLLGHGSRSNLAVTNSNDLNQLGSSTVQYYGVCLTVWSHADAERSSAIRRTLEAGRSRKESAQSLVASRLKNLRADVSGVTNDGPDPTLQARRSAKKNFRGPWVDGETDGGETEAEGAMSESDFEVASTVGHGPGESTLFLPGDTVFWLPYALSRLSVLAFLAGADLHLQPLYLATPFMTLCATTSPCRGRVSRKTYNRIHCKFLKSLPILPRVLVMSLNSTPVPRATGPIPTWKSLLGSLVALILAVVSSTSISPCGLFSNA